jgi:hypothetical protein
VSHGVGDCEQIGLVAGVVGILEEKNRAITPGDAALRKAS